MCTIYKKPIDSRALPPQKKTYRAERSTNIPRKKAPGPNLFLVVFPCFKIFFSRIGGVGKMPRIGAEIELESKMPFDRSKS